MNKTQHINRAIGKSAPTFIALLILLLSVGHLTAQENAAVSSMHYGSVSQAPSAYGLVIEVDESSASLPGRIAERLRARIKSIRAPDSGPSAAPNSLKKSQGSKPAALRERLQAIRPARNPLAHTKKPSGSKQKRKTSALQHRIDDVNVWFRPSFT